MAIQVERTSTRFIGVLVLSALAYGAWRTFTSRHAEPSAPITAIEPFWILLLLVLAIMVFTAVSAASGSTRTRPHRSTLELRTRNDALEEKNDSLERYRTAHDPDPHPPTRRIQAKNASLERHKIATERDAPKSWDRLSKRERAHILGWIALMLSMAFHPIGGIIGLIILRRYSGADSMMVTIARVLIILGFVFTAIIFWPLIRTAFNQ